MHPAVWYGLQGVLNGLVIQRCTRGCVATSELASQTGPPRGGGPGGMLPWGPSLNMGPGPPGWTPFFLCLCVIDVFVLIIAQAQ